MEEETPSLLPLTLLESTRGPTPATSRPSAPRSLGPFPATLQGFSRDTHPAPTSSIPALKAPAPTPRGTSPVPRPRSAPWEP